MLLLNLNPLLMLHISVTPSLQLNFHLVISYLLPRINMYLGREFLVVATCVQNNNLKVADRPLETQFYTLICLLIHVVIRDTSKNVRSLFTLRLDEPE